jgi:hypothetical protein
MNTWGPCFAFKGLILLAEGPMSDWSGRENLNAPKAHKPP